MLTARLRRLITASQRFTKSRQILQIHQTQSQSQPTMILSAPLYPLPSTFNDTLNPKMAAKIERQQRWEERVNVGTVDLFFFFLPVISVSARMHLVIFFSQMDQTRRGWFLPRGLHIWCCFWPKPRPIWLDQVQGHGTAAQENWREPSKIPLCFCCHVSKGVSFTTKRRRSELILVYSSINFHSIKLYC